MSVTDDGSVRAAPRFGVALAAMLFMAALAGCTPPADNSAGGDQFAAQFDKGMHDSCVKAFTGKGGSPEKAETYCGCVVVETNKLSNADKLTLGMHQDKLQQIAQTCITQMSGGASTNSTP